MSIRTYDDKHFGFEKIKDSAETLEKLDEELKQAKHDNFSTAIDIWTIQTRRLIRRTVVSREPMLRLKEINDSACKERMAMLDIKEQFKHLDDEWKEYLGSGFPKREMQLTRMQIDLEFNYNTLEKILKGMEMCCVKMAAMLKNVREKSIDGYLDEETNDIFQSILDEFYEMDESYGKFVQDYVLRTLKKADKVLKDTMIAGIFEIGN